MKQTTRSHWAAVALHALLTTAVTILTTLVIDYCSSRSGHLSYGAQVSEPFDKDSLHLRTCQLELRNDGDAILEDIKGQVQFEGQQIVACKLKGTPAMGIQDSLAAHSYWLRLPFLNPMEKLAIAFLLSGGPAMPPPPLVDVRARGSTAVGRADGAWIGRPFPLYIVLLLVAILFSVLVNRLAGAKR